MRIESPTKANERRTEITVEEASAAAADPSTRASVGAASPATASTCKPRILPSEIPTAADRGLDGKENEEEEEEAKVERERGEGLIGG